jgi:hypothetical protein
MFLTMSVVSVQYHFVSPVPGSDLPLRAQTPYQEPSDLPVSAADWPVPAAAAFQLPSDLPARPTPPKHGLSRLSPAPTC